MAKLTHFTNPLTLHFTIEVQLNLFLMEINVKIVQIHKKSTCCELHALCFKALTEEAACSQRSCESNH